MTIRLPFGFRLSVRVWRGERSWSHARFVSTRRPKPVTSPSPYYWRSINQFSEDGR